jgi:hypothetical protein
MAGFQPSPNGRFWVTPEVHEGQAFFASGKGIPMEDVLAEFGMKPEDFPLSK